jgi:hypothetical protein
MEREQEERERKNARLGERVRYLEDEVGRLWGMVKRLNEKEKGKRAEAPRVPDGTKEKTPVGAKKGTSDVIPGAPTAIMGPLLHRPGIRGQGEGFWLRVRPMKVPST